MERASKKNLSPEGSPAADEGLISMQRREPGKKIFPLNESPAAEEGLVAMKKSLEKKLSAERIPCS